MCQVFCPGVPVHDKNTTFEKLASFPGSPLAPMKNRNGGGEPGIDSHVILGMTPLH